ncbi:hypothetical protein Acsp04_52660 [Actinomadura sp. NBRC 104425]|nr:hypothetical protein Acsp04_52660 [Actinomadura sp. NBRC 104425]
MHGTRNVLSCCIRTSADLVYTMSPSVVHDGRNLEWERSRPQRPPISDRLSSHQAAAETLVRAAAQQLPTMVLRPH